MYYISFLSENTIIQTLWTHPLHWQFHCTTLLSLSEVVFGIDILSQTEVRDLYHMVKVNPMGSNAHLTNLIGLMAR